MKQGRGKFREVGRVNLFHGLGRHGSKSPLITAYHMKYSMKYRVPDCGIEMEYACRWIFYCRVIVKAFDHGRITITVSNAFWLYLELCQAIG